MKQEEWTKQLRNRLDDHQEAVPDDLWAGIEAGLDTPVSQHRVASSWRRWAVAAVATLLLAGGSLLLWERGEKRDAVARMEQQRNETTEAKALKSTETDASVVEEKIETPQLVAQNHTKGQTLCVVETEVPGTQAIEVPDAEVTTTPQEETVTPQEEATSTAHTMTIEKTVAQTLPNPQDPFAVIGEQRHDNRQLLAALFVGNGQYNHDDVAHVQMSDAMAQKYNAMNASVGSRSDGPIWLADYEEREHHERPFTIGLQLRYPLTERLSLSSGLVYTRLKSEFTKLMKGNEIQQQQQLHYLGIPFTLQYRLLKLGHLSVYASGGGQADWNVSAHMGVNGLQTDIDKDRLQWSLSGGLGLAYDVTPHVALFAEPGIKHYFDNHSPVHNYFKDKPTNLSLRVGVQLNMGNK